MTDKLKNPNKKIETKFLPSKFMLMVRMLVGAYLLYTSYTLVQSLIAGTAKNKYVFAVVVVLFTIIGIGLIIVSLWHMYKGRYVGGALDAGEPQAEVTEAEVTQAEVTQVDATEAAETTETIPVQANISDEVNLKTNNETNKETNNETNNETDSESESEH